MARRTARDFLDEMDLALGGPEASIPGDSMKLRWLNTAYTLDICSGYDFAELTALESLTCTASQAYVDHTATDILRLKDPTDTTTTGVPLTEIDKAKYDRLAQGSASTGNPIYWHLQGVTTAKLPRTYLYPTPDTTYALSWPYRKRPTLLVLSPFPTSTILPEEWDEVLLNVAISRGWMRLGDIKKAQAFRAQSLMDINAVMGISARMNRVMGNQGSFVLGAVNG